MPSVETLENFIGRVESNLHAEALEEFYTEDASIQENQHEPRVGRDRHVAHERQLFAKVKSVSSRCIRPVLVNGETVVIRWLFEFEFLDGSTMRREELAYQTWIGEKVSCETFFYDPSQ